MKIVNAVEDRNLVTKKDAEIHTFGITDSAIFLHNLSDTLYQNKLLAAIREPICNAWDAHVDAGIPEVPIDIYFTEFDLVIKDYGKGIPSDIFHNVFGVYGYSTKNEDNTQTGGFGLGCKAPFAYSDTFSVTSSNNGTRTVYSISKTSAIGGKPSITVMVQMPTTETGIEIRIPYIKEDKNKIREYVEQTAMYSQQKINFRDDEDSENVILPNVISDLDVEDFGYIIGDCSVGEKPLSELNILYSNVLYPVETENLSEATKSALSNLESSFQTDSTHLNNLVFRADPGNVYVTPSRESLSYQEQTIDYIEGMVLKIFDEVCKLNHNAKLNSLIEETFKNIGTNELSYLVSHSSENRYKGTYALLDKLVLNKLRSWGNTLDIPKVKFTMYNAHFTEKALIKGRDNLVFTKLLSFSTHYRYVHNYVSAKLIAEDKRIDFYNVIRGHHSRTKAETYKSNKASYKTLGKFYTDFFKLDVIKNLVIFGDVTSSLKAPKSSKVSTLIDKASGWYRVEFDDLLEDFLNDKIIYIYNTKTYLDEHKKGIESKYLSESILFEYKAYKVNKVLSNTLGLSFPEKDKDKVKEVISYLKSKGYLVIDYYSEELHIKEVTKRKKRALVKNNKLLGNVKEDKEKEPKTTSLHTRSSFVEACKMDRPNLVSDIPEVSNPKFVEMVPNVDIRLGYKFSYIDEFSRNYPANSDNYEFLAAYLEEDLKVDGAIVSTELRLEKALEDGLEPFHKFFLNNILSVVSDPKNADSIKRTLLFNSYDIVKLFDTHLYPSNAPHSITVDPNFESVVKDFCRRYADYNDPVNILKYKDTLDDVLANISPWLNKNKDYFNFGGKYENPYLLDTSRDSVFRALKAFEVVARFSMGRFGKPYNENKEVFIEILDRLYAIVFPAIKEKIELIRVKSVLDDVISSSRYSSSKDAKLVSSVISEIYNSTILKVVDHVKKEIN